MRTVFDKDKLTSRLEELTREEQNPLIFGEFEKIKHIGKEKRQLEQLLGKLSSSEKQVDDLVELFDLLTVENASEEEWKTLEDEYKSAKSEIDQLYIETLYDGENDDADALVELHAGAGGEEAQDWTQMLMRMYTRYAEKQGFDVKVPNYLYGEGAGYKSVSLMIEGKHAYGNLKCERGVHRLVRISPFDASKRRHTSFASVEVSPVITDTSSIQIRPEELKIDTYRSSGAGGQHVNKTESAVRITHIPTGIIVACQNERSQTQNKEYAMKMLYAKLAELAEKEKEKERLKKLGLQMKIEWGSQIRSYVLCPYNLVKDHRTGYEDGDTTAVLDGDIQNFIIEKLKADKQNG